MSHRVSWPHAPAHFFDDEGTYIVTTGTYRRLHLFDTRAKLDGLQESLFAIAEEFGVALQAWAIFSNHYHFVAQVAEPKQFPAMIGKLHAVTARELNERDETPGRKVWFQYWETRLTFERSYFARLHYVHRNAVHHGLVRAATRYPWCSAGWFEVEAPRAFRKAVLSTPCDLIRIADGFEVVAPADTEVGAEK